jgi:hypothetical protein
MNDDVTPGKKRMFQHGANDNYFEKDAQGNVLRNPDGTEQMKRSPEPNEKFLIVEPDGTTKC